MRNKRPFVAAPAIEPIDLESLKVPSFRCQTGPQMIAEIIQGRNFSLNADKTGVNEFENEFRHAFFADVNHSESPSDIRAVWEPARLQHIALVLISMLQDSEQLDASAVKTIARETVINWINNNAFLKGPHYISAMECGLRIPVFFYCLKFLDNLSSTEYRLILDAMYRHGWWIFRRLSLYSSLGNHTIAESVGLIFAGAVFRNVPEGGQWLEKGCQLLKAELYHQVLKDGGPAEQSFNYHRFILDLYWLSVGFLEKNRLHDCSDWKPRLSKGEKFLSAFQNNCRKMLSVGDSDDAHAVAPGIFPEKPGILHEKREVEVFKDSGYTVINTSNGFRLTFDHGPLGMPPLYNHGHADALSITLTKGDQPILVDPGTYRYNGVEEWRRYFKGTRAHNTVTVDDLDQATQETGFIWSHAYNARLLSLFEHDDGFILKAAHDGYARLDSPVYHQRLIYFYDQTTFIIKDTFSGQGIHKFELNFHLHPDSIVTTCCKGWLIHQQGYGIFIKKLDEVDFQLISGQESPKLGWYSACYGQKRKCAVLSCRKSGRPEELLFATMLWTDPPV